MLTTIISWTAIRPFVPTLSHWGQPTGSCRRSTGGIVAPIWRNRASVSTSGTTSRRQTGQSLRTRRWATTPTSVEAIRNGATPMSSRRMAAPGGLVAVQRGQHQVAGQGRAEGDLGGLGVADLADQHDVRVLAQNGAQLPGEGQARPLVDVGLADAVQFVLDRVFAGDDVGGRRAAARSARRTASSSCPTRSGR